jgi:ABC-2 type transport system ATP-binding protein
MLSLSKIKKHYHHFLALDIPEINFEKGLSWIKGANGSGKTTLFKIISGIAPFDGEIILNDTISCKKNPQQYRLHVNYAPAEPVYPAFLTGKDLLDFYLSCKKGNEEQVKMLCDMFGMNEYVSNPVGTYSSGMLKKFSITCAFIGNPKLIVLDEPLITLDEASSNHLYNLIKETLKSDLAIFISSHQQVNLSRFNGCKNYVVENKTITRI